MTDEERRGLVCLYGLWTAAADLVKMTAKQPSHYRTADDYITWALEREVAQRRCEQMRALFEAELNRVAQLEMERRYRVPSVPGLRDTAP